MVRLFLPALLEAKSIACFKGHKVSSRRHKASAQCHKVSARRHKVSARRHTVSATNSLQLGTLTVGIAKPNSIMSPTDKPAVRQVHGQTAPYCYILHMYKCLTESAAVGSTGTSSSRVARIVMPAVFGDDDSSQLVRCKVKLASQSDTKLAA